MDETLALRLRVEDLLYEEADLLDRWQLDAWLALYTQDAHYLVPPSDVDGDTANPDTSLFYIMDDHVRMRERVVRLNKVGEEGRIHARSSFVVWRSKDITSDAFVGHYLHEIVETGATLKIAKKTCVLDMEALRPHARISIIL